MNDIITAIIVILGFFVFFYIMGKAFESDLKDLEKTNPRLRKYLKDKYNM